MKSLTGLLIAVLCVGASASAKENPKWRVPCEKVFVTGTQKAAIAWALKGEGLKNRLYERTCQEPVPSPAQASAILDIEPDQNLVEANEEKAGIKRDTGDGSYFVTCSSSLSGYYCEDSDGYVLSASCVGQNCATYYGPDPLAQGLQALDQILEKHLLATDAWAYLFSTKDHKLLWKYEGAGVWDFNLAKSSACRKNFGFGPRSNVCKKAQISLAVAQFV